MIKFKYDKEVYSKGYGKAFNRAVFVFMPGFILAFLILLTQTAFPSVNLDLSNMPVSELIAIYTAASFIGYPSALLIRMGYRVFCEESILRIDDGTLKYDVLVKRNWTLAGYVTIYHNYVAKRINQINVGKRFYDLVAEFEKTVIYKGNEEPAEIVGEMRVPIAFKDMERLLEYGNWRIDPR
ncbi:MAG: hypothetical protein GXZ13_07485 [Synergistaceae bacterium]|nr:hypothetical protein [Synergistaceae bacterium]